MQVTETTTFELDDTQLASVVGTEVSRQVAEIPAGKDGAAGADGHDGAPGAVGPEGPVGPVGPAGPGGGGGGAVVGLPYTVVTAPTDQAVQAGVKAWLGSRNSAGFPLTRLAFAFQGTANLTTPLLPAGTGQIQGARWEGLGKRNTVLAWSDPKTPMLTAASQLRNFRFDGFSLQATAPNALGWKFDSTVAPFNQDGVFRELEWMGSWQYGIQLIGNGKANLNSELIFDRVAMGNDASFADAWFWCGAGDNQGAGGGQNQFLNYVFRDTKLEGSHGDYIRFDYGGSFTVTGMNSWIHTGQANGGTPSGRMIYLKNGYTGDSTMRAILDGIRAELRGPKSVFIDSNWSGPSHISIRGLNSAANAFKFGTPTEQYSIRGGNVHIQDSHLQGFIGAYGSARIVLDETTGAQGQTPQNLVHTMSGTPTTITR